MSLRAWIVAALLVAGCAVGRADEGRIRPYEGNPYYWQYRGEPVLLLGGSVNDNLFQTPEVEAHLDRLRAAGGNYVRNTMSCRDEGDLWPFARQGDKYDLDRWNDAFWARFDRFLAATAQRDVIVQIEIWATFDYYRDLWARNPFNPKNNVNYTAEESGLPLVVDSHPVRTENDFFRSVPKARNLPVVLEYQRRFVEKILSYSLRHDHVLYAMDNETSVTPHWGEYWATFIRDQAARAGKQVETTEMWDPWDLDHPMHWNTVDHPEIYTFVDVSQNNHQKGQKHYDNALRRRRSLRRKPRPMTNVKIYGADGGRFGDSRDGVERFWRNIFGGHSAVRFHRPDSGIGLSGRAQQMIRSARAVTDAVDVFSCRPRPDLLADRQPNEAYCLADAGRQYAVYFPAAGDVKLTVKATRGKLTVRWYDVDRGRWLDREQPGATDRLHLKTPGPGQWAVIVAAATGE